MIDLIFSFIGGLMGAGYVLAFLAMLALASLGQATENHGWRQPRFWFVTAPGYIASLMVAYYIGVKFG